MANPLYALILAGGSGERFWPLSRRTRPKQLLRLVAQQPLLEQAVTRLEGLVAPERLLILTNVDQEAAVRELLPQVPKENIVAEPAKRDTRRRLSRSGWDGSRPVIIPRRCSFCRQTTLLMIPRHSRRL